MAKPRPVRPRVCQQNRTQPETEHTWEQLRKEPECLWHGADSTRRCNSGQFGAVKIWEGAES
jgi:hypothetical protein